MNRVTTAVCLRPAASAPTLRLFLSPSAFPSSTQRRRQVTIVKPAKQKPDKIKQDTSAVPLNKIDQIDWSKIDLSEISRPPPSNPEPTLHYEDGKTYFKHPLSRKVYLHTLYTNLLLRHPLLLFFNITAMDFHTMVHLRTALMPMGIHLKVIRRRVFISALRVAQYVEASRTRPGELWDPSGLAMRQKVIDRKRTTEEFELTALLKGKQTCAVYFNDFNWRPESIDPGKIAAVVRMLDRTGKTPIIGARFQRSVITAEDVRRLRGVGGHQKVGGELVGILGGAAQMLAGTLSAPAGGLAFTLEGRRKAMEDEQGVTT